MLPGLVECGTVIHSLNVILLQNRVVICIAQSTDWVHGQDWHNRTDWTNRHKLKYLLNKIVQE